MTKDELGALVAARQFRGDERRVELSITPTIPIFMLRRGQAVKIDPADVPAAELTALGYTASVEVLATKTWRVEGFSVSVELDPEKGEARVERGAIRCEEVVR